jgi:hypothetical protein
MLLIKQCVTGGLLWSVAHMPLLLADADEFVAVLAAVMVVPEVMLLLVT